MFKRDTMREEEVDGNGFCGGGSGGAGNGGKVDNLT